MICSGSSVSSPSGYKGTPSGRWYTSTSASTSRLYPVTADTGTTSAQSPRALTATSCSTTRSGDAWSHLVTIATTGVFFTFSSSRAKNRSPGPCTMPRITRLVVCGRSLVIATLAPTSAFVSVDLPTFGRPARQANPERKAVPTESGADGGWLTCQFSRMSRGQEPQPFGPKRRGAGRPGPCGGRGRDGLGSQGLADGAVGAGAEDDRVGAEVADHGE